MSKHTHQHQAFWVKLEDVHSSLKLTAYQIHQEKSGTAFDNWLEAERKLKNVETKELTKEG